MYYNKVEDEVIIDTLKKKWVNEAANKNFKNFDYYLLLFLVSGRDFKIIPYPLILI